MRKILFVIPEYSHGGTNKSLENMLGLIDKAKYDISIYCLYEDGGEYYKEVFAPYVLKKSKFYYWMHDNVCTRKVMGLYNKKTKRNNFGWLYSREVRYIQEKKDFDVVVAFQEGTSTMFVSEFQNVRKIAWIHCDYGAWAKNNRRKKDEEYYRNMNSIVCVSESAKQSFLSIFPEFQDKTSSIYNLVNVQDVKSKTITPSDEQMLEKQCFRIVSVGRLNSVKQFEKIPEIANYIKKNAKRPIHWLIIGSGASEGAIREEIAKFSLQNEVILLGAKDNPYPYMGNADLVACTSASESFSYIIAEAKVLHTPVLSNDFPVAYEVVDEQTGWIANIKDMPQLLTRIINDEDGEYSRKKTSAMNYEYSNEEILQKIDSLFQS